MSDLASEMKNPEQLKQWAGEYQQNNNERNHYGRSRKPARFVLPHETDEFGKAHFSTLSDSTKGSNF